MVELKFFWILHWQLTCSDVVKQYLLVVDESRGHQYIKIQDMLQEVPRVSSLNTHVTEASGIAS